MGDSGGVGANEPGAERRLRLYAGVTLALILVAALSYLLVPSGSGIAGCRSLLLQNSRYSCIESIAVSTLNSSACSGMPSSYSDPCYLQIAQARNDSTLCAMLSSSAKASSCAEGIYVTKNSYGSCSSMGQPYSSMCKAAIAVRLSNQSMCSGLANSTSTLACISVIGMNKMLKSGNFSYCGSVTSLNDRNLTSQIIANFSYVSGGAYSNVTIGFGALAFVPSSSFSARDFCYALAAARLSKSSLCQGIADTSARGVCTMNAGPQPIANTTFNYTQSLAGCAQAGANSQMCIQTVELEQAIKTRNVSLCGSLVSILSVGCYSALAAAYSNASYCSYISNATQRGSCVSGVPK